MASRSKTKDTNHKTHSLSPNELSVQGILAKADKPLSAYEIIPLMSKRSGNAIAPATVYRALKHLAEHGLVTRIESRNAYVLCQHPHENHDCIFFICRKCGEAIEAVDSKVSGWLRKEAEHIGFGINKQILEIEGLCKACSRAI